MGCGDISKRRVALTTVAAFPPDDGLFLEENGRKPAPGDRWLDTRAGKWYWFHKEWEDR